MPSTPCAGKDFHGQRHVPAVRGKQEILHVQRQVGHLSGFAAVDGNSPHLRRSRSRGKKEDRPCRRATSEDRCRWPRRRSIAAARLRPSRTSQRLVFPLFSSMSVVRTVKTTRVPSGDTRGSEIRCMASMSWTVNGCDGAPAQRAIATLARRELLMVGLPWVSRRSFCVVSSRKRRLSTQGFRHTGVPPPKWRELPFHRQNRPAPPRSAGWHDASLPVPPALRGRRSGTQNNTPSIPIVTCGGHPHRRSEAAWPASKRQENCRLFLTHRRFDSRLIFVASQISLCVTKTKVPIQRPSKQPC